MLSNLIESPTARKHSPASTLYRSNVLSASSSGTRAQQNATPPTCSAPTPPVRVMVRRAASHGWCMSRDEYYAIRPKHTHPPASDPSLTSHTPPHPTPPHPPPQAKDTPKTHEKGRQSQPRHISVRRCAFDVFTCQRLARSCCSCCSC